MKRISASLWLFIVMGVLLGGCLEVQRTKDLEEDGVVIQTIHRPYHVHASSRPNVVTDANGNTSVIVTIEHDAFSEAFYVVFACQHGQFVIDSEDAWRKVSPGMRVRIKYNQLDFYMKRRGEPKTHVNTGFEFVDCWPLSSEWNIDDVKVGK